MLLGRSQVVGCESSFHKFVCFKEHIDGVIVLMIILNIVVYKLRQLQESKYGEKDSKPELSSGKTCRRFSLAEIERATNNFDDEFVIGHGGSGKVYKGMIDNGATIVAIKRLSSMSREGSREFWKEIEMVSQFKHCHLVDLIGYCDEWGVMILVYEYMPKGTLADHLHRTGRKGNNSPLSWVQRLRICIGAARGLDYLHTGTSTRQRVIHRDVKSTNILLDENFEAKISDFGLSKIGPANQASSYASTNVKGTFGYIDPEYFLTRRVTRKSDVYAFGVVLLEAVCGRRAVDLSVDDDQRGLVGWVQNCIKEGRVHQVLDYSLNMQIVPTSLIAFLKIADQCLHSQPTCRPTMAEIVVMLEFALTLQENEDSSEVEEAVTCYQYNALPSTSEDVMYTGCYPMSFTRKIRQFLAAPTQLIPVQNRVNNRVRLDNMGIVQVARGRIVTTNIKMFTSRELRYATRNFSSNMQLSEGWYGSIFIAWVNEKTFAPSRAGRGMGLIIARFNSCEGHKEVQKEVDHYGKFRHPNVVKLLGFCLENQEFILVYEYMQKGSLERYIYKDYAEPLPWVVWLKILIVAARFLAFLHTAENQTIYNHFNPYNILLDGDFNAKIVGCGVARFASADDGDTFLTSQQVLYTRSYLSPEYVEAGCLSVKNDVFSFGVLLLEILTGMRVSDFDQNHRKQNLVKWMRPLLTDERMVKKIMYPKLPDHDKFLEGKILSDIPKLVLECLDRNPEKRPSMMEVLETLEEISAFSK